MKKGDIVNIKHIRNDVLLQLTDEPVKAKAINGVSGADELLLQGWILNKTRNKFCIDSRYKGKKSFIVKENKITLVKDYTKLRLYIDGKCGYEYDTVEEIKEFLSKAKFIWDEAVVFDPYGKIVYEEINSCNLSCEYQKEHKCTYDIKSAQFPPHCECRKGY